MQNDSLTIEQILREIKSKKGEEFLLNKERTLSICSDLAGNQLGAQRNCLKIFMDCDGPRCIISLGNADAQTRQLRFGHLVQKMRDQFFVQEAAALEMCSIFWRVVFDTPAPAYSVSCVESGKKPDATKIPNHPGFTQPSHKQEDVPCASKNYLPLDYDAPLDYERNLPFANQGDAHAQRILGDCCKYGAGGVPKDYEQAAKWYIKSSKQGNARAQWELSFLYFRGWGVPEDSAEGMKWLRKSAERGYASAQHDLGDHYYNGSDGVPVNKTEGVKWYRLAAKQGNLFAQNALKFLGIY